MKTVRTVFLLGAGRSGTTLLYKILSSHRGIGYFSNYQSHFPSQPWMGFLHRLPRAFPVLKREFWFDDQGGAYFNERRKVLKSWVPTPAEAEAIYAKAGIPLTADTGYVPSAHSVARLRDVFGRLLRASGGEILLSKRTANNRRIPIIQHIFPDAKFIHLVRDGRSVAHSLLKVQWWDDHVLYWSGRTPRQMVEAGEHPLELAARNWSEEMASLEKGIESIARSQLLEVRYEALLNDPHAELRRMIDFLGISKCDDRHFWRIVDSLALAAKPETWQTAWGPEDRGRVTRLQAPTLRRWGFPTEVN